MSVYLKDETGGRRYWPVKCGTVDLAALERDRDQLWAEAVAEYRDGRAWWPATGEQHAQLEEQQEERRQPDPWEEPIARWLEKPRVSDIATSEILGECLGKKPGDWTRADENRVGASMRALGYERDRAYDESGKRHRVWRLSSQDVVNPIE